MLDSPTTGSTANSVNENTVKTQLETKFNSFGYKILQWNKNDIRDKTSYTTEEKTGYFTDKGKIKDNSELDDFEQKVSAIKDYFKDD